MSDIFGGGSGAGRRARRTIRDPEKSAFVIRGGEEAQDTAKKEFERSRERSERTAQQRQQLIQQLQEQAAGRGPSLAEAQLKSAQEQNLRQQVAAAAAQRGGSTAATQRQLVRSQAEGGQQVRQEAATARIQESTQARQELGQITGQEQQLADSLTTQFLQQGFNFAQAQQAALAELQRLRLQRDLGISGAEQAGAAGQRQLIGGILEGGAGILAASDRRGKENIKSAKKDTKDFLDNLAAYSYNYKDDTLPGTAKGKRFGVMAQDLEKSKMGASLVKDTPFGKMIDVSQGFGAVVAAQVHLHERLKEFEKKKKD